MIAVAASPARAAMRTALEDRGFTIAAEAVDARSALVAAKRERPDLCLIDLDLPGDGLAAVGRIATALPGTTVVALAPVEDGAQMIAALEHGASGYLRTDFPADDLAKTLRAAHAGEPALSRSLVPHLIEHLRRGSSSRLELGDLMVTLTPRERDVVELVRKGWPTGEIARRLGLSPVTVRRHISSVSRKTGIPGRVALAEALKGSIR